MANLKGRVVALERRHLKDQPVYGVQFDRDALAIYNAMAYLDATMEPTYHEVEATAIYVRQNCGMLVTDRLFPRTSINT